MLAGFKNYDPATEKKLTCHPVATMATTPSAYSTVSGDDFHDDTNGTQFSNAAAAADDDGTMAIQSLDLEHVQNQNEMRSKEHSLRSKLMVSVCLLAAMAFGGREYYVRNYNIGAEEIVGVGSSSSLEGGDAQLSIGIRGNSNDVVVVESSSNLDEDELNEIFDLMEGGSGELLGGHLDEDNDNEEDAGVQEEEEKEENTTEEEVSPAEESKQDEKFPQEEIPDYFTPLTPDERTELKERLRATVRATRDALVLSDLADREDDGLTRQNQLIDGGPISSPQRTLVLGSGVPKQFMHMHHMKTGGTSLDGLISCALRRQKDVMGDNINYRRMSECGSGVRSCMGTLAKKLDASVVDNVFFYKDETSFDPANVDIADLNVCETSEAEVMSYCASLHTVRTFGWSDVDKVTVIRHPVERAWSMYRFKLNQCYDCKELKEVLRKVADGTFVRKRHGLKMGEGGEEKFVYSPNDSCAVQMIGHQATNLLSSVELYNVANDVRFPREKEIADEAVRNLREVFTWIGLTDRITESIDGMRTVFPFLAENLNDAATVFRDALKKNGEEVDGSFSLPEGYNDEKGCSFEHRNAGREPTCGTKEMDEETIFLINKLTARDMAVYKAAVERFELQQEVLEEFWDGSL